MEEKGVRRLNVLQGHLEVLDSRTNKSYSIKIHNNTVQASHLGKLTDRDNEPLYCYDPGYLNT